MYNKYIILCNEKKLSSYKVSKDTGISQSVLHSWKIGRSKPKADKLQKLADYFGVTIDYFLK